MTNNTKANAKAAMDAFKYEVASEKGSFAYLKSTTPK